MYNLMEESKSSNRLHPTEREEESKRRIETGDGERERMQSVLREWEGQKVSWWGSQIAA